jgi:Flp pilus assembly protein CpaB
MKPKTMILMILAIVCGLVASYMTSQLIAQNKEMAVVLRTKAKMTQWSTIRDPADQFEEIEILKKNAPQNAVHPAEWKKDSKEGGLRGRRLRSTVDENTVLTEDHLLKKEVSGIDGMLDKGKRAMSIPISADRAVAFFVVPGSKVDVVHTQSGVSKVLLENVLVLAIDLATQRAEDRVGAPGATATLQMDNTEQVLTLTGARDRGTLSLVMRPPNDDGQSKESETVGTVAVAPPPPPPPFEDPKEEPKVTGPTKVTPKAPPTRFIDIIVGPSGARHFYTVEKDGSVIYDKSKAFDEVRADMKKAQQDRNAEKPPVEKAPPEKPDDK